MKLYLNISRKVHKENTQSPLRNLLAIFTVLCLLCVTLFSCGNKKEAKNNNIAEYSKIQAVEVVKPQPRSFKGEILITGTAMPNQKVMIHAMESGYLKSILKDIGDNVRQGDLIAILENPSIAQLLSDAQADLQVGHAELLTIQSEMVAAQADFKVKDALSKRLNEVYEKTPQLTPISEVEKAEGDALIAKAAVETTKARALTQERKIEALQKRVKIAEKRNAMLNIKAPFNGVITQRMVDKGAMIQSGINSADAGAIVEIQDINPIRLTLFVPESDAGAIKKGTEAAITFPELAGQTFKAKVSRTSKALDLASKTMQVEIDIANPDGFIITGMYAKVLMQIDSRDNVLSLPLTAQTMYQDEPFLLLVKNDKVERIPLRKGLSNKDYFEILNSEIKEEAQVIVQGKSLVKPGQIVKPVFKGE